MLIKQFVLSSMAVVIFLTPAISQDRESSGIITMTDGTQHDAIRISPQCIYTFGRERNNKGFMRSDGTFRLTRPSGDVAVSVPVERVASISIFASKGVSNGWRYVTEGVLTLSNESEVMLEDNEEIMTRNSCQVTIFDEFTDSVQEVSLSHVGDNRIVQIDYTGTGTYRWSETSDRVFPVSFLFDPYTGERTVLRGGAN